MTDPIKPTRAELSEISKNQRVLRAIEQLFDIVPVNLTALQADIDAATAAAVAAQGTADNNAADIITLTGQVSSLSTSLTALSAAVASLVASLGTLSTQDADAVAITDGTVQATLTDDTANLIASSTNLGDGAGVSAGTLTNAPSAGDPSKWVPIDDNGTTRYVPSWT